MLIVLAQTNEKVRKAYLNTTCSSHPFCSLSVCHVIDPDLDQSLTDQSIIKSKKYYKYQESILKYEESTVHFKKDLFDDRSHYEYH